MGCLFGGLNLIVASGAGRVWRQRWKGTMMCGIRPELDATEGAAILERDCIVSWGVGSVGAALGNLRLAHPSPGYGNEGTNVRLCRRTKTLAGNHLNPRDGGNLAELGAKADIFHAPAHPYTQGLLHAIPTLSTDRAVPLATIEGTVPDRKSTRLN